MNITIFGCSMHPLSRSFVLAKQAAQNLKDHHGVNVRLIDLRDYDMVFCGQPEARDQPGLEELQSGVQEASAILVAVPIYNFYINAAAKNLIELTGRSWMYKLVGFLCAAGGTSSYMSVMSIANSLMLDFRTLIVPRFVYATSDAFGNDRTKDMYVSDERILDRIKELTDITVALAKAVDPVIESLPEPGGRA